MTKRQIVYNDWSKGDSGNLAPAPNQIGYFRGQNVVVYQNGAVGTRPPFVFLSTSLPNRAVVQYIFNHSQNRVILIFDDKTVYAVNPASGATNLVGTLATAVSGITSSGNEIFGCRSGGTGVRINLATGVFTEIAAMPAGLYISVYGAQYVVSGDSSYPNRLHYSTLGDPTLWPGNFVDVGAADSITGLFLQRNALVVPKDDGTWWVVSGVLGAETVRKSERGLRLVGNTPSALTTAQNIVWFAGSVPQNIYTFSGAQIIAQPAPDAIGVEAGTYVDTTPNSIDGLSVGDDIIVTGKLTASSSVFTPFVHLRQGNAWTRHATTMSIGTTGAIQVSALALKDGGVAIFTMGQTSSSTPPVFYVFNSVLGFPFLSNNDGNTSAKVVGTLQPSEYWPENGDLCRITEVIVDLSFPYDNATSATLTLTANALNRVQGDDGVSSATQTWTPQTQSRPASTSIRKRTRQRAVFTFGDQGEGGGASLSFSAMTLVQIHRVIMVVDEMPASMI